MEEIQKIANNLTWFRPIVEKSRINFKNAHKELTDFDESKITRDLFHQVGVQLCRSWCTFPWRQNWSLPARKRPTNCSTSSTTWTTARKRAISRRKSFNAL